MWLELPDVPFRRPPRRRTQVNKYISDKAGRLESPRKAPKGNRPLSHDLRAKGQSQQRFCDDAPLESKTRPVLAGLENFRI